ncbi:hypothetical protein BN1723_002040 [Verticillium longisporum]|uniref:Uncharacterized protein n=1 Tax=Verticillium longisporum TaxID=100787 RepID=A0A0G4KVQ3_VERLO|nr:hypothetical protein BN1723_002040 [Verticillium longisporum]
MSISCQAQHAAGLINMYVWKTSVLLRYHHIVRLCEATPRVKLKPGMVQQCALLDLALANTEGQSEGRQQGEVAETWQDSSSRDLSWARGYTLALNHQSFNS